jgi:hypothetical protein
MGVAQVEIVKVWHQMMEEAGSAVMAEAAWIEAVALLADVSATAKMTDVSATAKMADVPATSVPTTRRVPSATMPAARKGEPFPGRKKQDATSQHSNGSPASSTGTARRFALFAQAPHLGLLIRIQV